MRTSVRNSMCTLEVSPEVFVPACGTSPLMHMPVCPDRVIVVRVSGRVTLYPCEGFRRCGQI